MNKKYLCLLLIISGSVLVWSNVLAVAPQISNAKFKSGGGNKVAVFFDQSVRQYGTGNAATTTDFILAGASSTGVTIQNAEANMNDNIFVLTLSASLNPSINGQWTIAASSSLRNSANEAATTTAVDLNGRADSAAPTVIGVFQHSSMSLDVMFSEEVDTQSASSSASYSNLQTSSATDTPVIVSRSMIPEKTFAILIVSTSTVLNWGAGDSINVGSVTDLVGNPLAATSTYTILPAIKISEVKALSSNNAQDEFVELYNFGDVNLNLSTSTFFLHFKNSSTDINIPLTLLKTQIPEKGYYLVGSQLGYGGAVGLDAGYSTSTDILTANSGVYISATSTPDQLVIDLLGMGTSTVKETATTTALANDKSLERKARSNSTTSTMATAGSDEFKGNSYDSNNNSVDFLLRDIPQPQNSSSPKEFPFGGPGANDTGAPQVTGSFPSGNAGEMVPNNLDYIGFGFNESVQENTVTSSTVIFYAGSASSTNLCSSISYTNFPAMGMPPGRCVVNPANKPLNTATTYTFRIKGDSANATSSIAVRDFASNALNQPVSFKGDGNGNYVIQFAPSASGGGYTFQGPSVFVMGSLPFPGAVNIPTNIQKVYVKFSGDTATSTVNGTNLRLVKVSDSSQVSLSSVTSAATESKFISDIAVLALGASLAANTQYQIAISGITDTSGNPVGSPPPFMFTTGASADVTGPIVSGRLPNISTGVPVNAIDIHIMTDDKLDPVNITTSTVKLFQGANQISGVAEFDPFTGEIMFLVNNVFQANTSYEVRLNATGTSPCVTNISGLCLQDNDGTADNLYKFSFTTGVSDTQGPRVIFANTDQRNLSISFDEPVAKLEAEDFNNYSLVVGGATTTLSSMAGQRIFYDAIGRTAVIENLNLAINASFTITVSNVHDLSGNLISSQNSAQGTVQDMSMTGGFVGPGGPMLGGDMPQNFSTSTFGFAPQVEVRPMSPMAGATTNYFVGIPISRQVKSNSANGKIILTFPTGFDVSGAALETNSPMASDINGPGPGTIAVNSIAVDATARTITITITINTRCDNGNSAPCSGDAHDFLNFDLRGIVNSSIPKDASSGGYTIDVKTMDSTTVLESLTSKAFYLAAGGTNSLVVSVSASGATSGTSTIRMFSPMSGPREAVTTAFSGGAGTSTFTGLLDGDYFVFTEPIVTLGGTDYIGRPMPTPVRVSGGATTTMAITLSSTAGLATATVNITGPAGKNIDVFAGSADNFIVKATTTTGSAQNVVLKLSNGNWFIGVGPQIPKGPFSGPPPAPDFVMQPPVQAIVSGSLVQENSGTANDGIVVFVLSSASLTLSGTVADASGRAIVDAEVFAYSPLGGFGTHGSTDGLGKFSLRVAAGTYQVGVFAPGLPPAAETAVEVKTDGSMVVDGQTISSVTLKLIKPERKISGKILDQNNNPAQGAGVFAYCDPSVSNNACFGPGDHTGSPTNSDGSYTLYVKNGTWRVGAFLPGFGELPQVQQVVSGSDVSNLNFSPSTNTTFNDVSGTVCRNTDASGTATTCGSGDQKISGVFVRAYSSAGANQTVTDQSGAYKIKIPANNNYTIEAFDPALGRLKSLNNVDVSNSTSSKDIVIGNPRTITVNVKNSAGASVNINQLFVDFFDFTNQAGNHFEIKNATSGTISLPDADYHIRASLPGQSLADSAIDSDNAGTAVATSTATLTVDGNETIKIIVPALGTISGAVYKGSVASGNELGDAFVNFANPTNGIFIGTQANASGAYAVKLPLGTYTAIAQKSNYLANPVAVTVSTTTATTTLNLIVNQASLIIAGTINISGSPASRAFVKAEKLGGGFSGTQTDSNGVYSLPVTSGTWRVFAMAEGYTETEYSSPLEVNANQTGININLTTKVTLAAPKVCQITPSQGGTCSDETNGVKVIVPPSAFGSDTNPATLTVKQTNTRQTTETTKPVGNGFDFEAVDSSGSKISTFNSAVTLEFTQSTSTLINSGITTKTKADGVKITLWSETIKDYDVLMTTVEYLNASNALVASPAENLSNVANVRFKALTTHFSGGGPGEGGDSLAPAAPGGVSGSANSSGITVSWSAVTTNSDGTSISDLSDYRIWRSTASDSGFTVISSVSAPTVSYSDIAAGINTTYYYRVTARDISNNESTQSASSASISRSASSGSSGGGGGGGIVVPLVQTTTTTATSTANAATTTAIAQVSRQITSSTTAPTIKPLVVAVQFVKRLIIGLKGEEVRQLQEFLAQDKEIYPEGMISGYFGSLTKKAVEKFQEKYSIANQGEAGYGEVGPKTRAKLNQLLSGSQAAIPQLPAVSSEQSQLVQQIKAQIQTLQEQLTKLLSELAKKLQGELQQKQGR